MVDRLLDQIGWKERLVGAVLLSMGLLLGFYNGIPWITRDEANQRLLGLRQEFADHVHAESLEHDAFARDIADIRARKQRLEDQVRELENNQARILERLTVLGLPRPAPVREPPSTPIPPR